MQQCYTVLVYVNSFKQPDKVSALVKIFLFETIVYDAGVGDFHSILHLYNTCILYISAELSHALYQHDAACRVIARLTKEVTAAREGNNEV